MIGAPRRNARKNNFKKTVNERIPCHFFRKEGSLYGKKKINSKIRNW